MSKRKLTPARKCLKNSKENKIRICLLAGNTLTPMEALKYFGHMRLADVVLDLRKEGHFIVNLNKSNPRQHAMYKLIRP